MKCVKFVIKYSELYMLCAKNMLGPFWHKAWMYYYVAYVMPEGRNLLGIMPKGA